jgi:YHS domain-containing protein
LNSWLNAVAFNPALRGRCQPPLEAEPVQRDTAAGAGQGDSRANTRTAPAAAAVDETFINPVCGMAVSIANSRHVEVYAGETYYFCCDNCWTTFGKDRAKYAAIRRASAGATAP